MLDLTGTFAIGPSFQGVLGNPAVTVFGYQGQPLAPQRSSPVGYYTGFLGTGTGQTAAGPSILSSIATGLETFLPAIFGGRSAPVTARTPPMLPGGTGGVPAAPVGTTTGQTPTSHPVLTTIGAVAAGGAAAIATGGMVNTALRSVGIGMGHARYAPAGTKGYHMIKKGPHAGMWTRNRHRNVANIRALRRALSRAHGFERIARKVCHFVKPGGGRGRAVFKRRRRKC